LSLQLREVQRDYDELKKRSAFEVDELERKLTLVISQNERANLEPNITGQTEQSTPEKTQKEDIQTIPQRSPQGYETANHPIVIIPSTNLTHNPNNTYSDLASQLTKEYTNTKQMNLNTTNSDYNDILGYNSGQS
jgi:hypothetical protein